MYPFSPGPPGSVDAFQARLIWLHDTAEAVSPVGTDGGEFSVVVVVFAVVVVVVFVVEVVVVVVVLVVDVVLVVLVVAHTGVVADAALVRAERFPELSMAATV